MRQKTTHLGRRCGFSDAKAWLDQAAAPRRVSAAIQARPTTGSFGDGGNGHSDATRRLHSTDLSVSFELGAEDSLGETVTDDDGETIDRNAKIIEEIIALQRNYYFEKRNVKTERQRKVREIIERAAKGE
ncbi:hypothetical protein [Mesorhizobium sp.]|uniref:hypothetical protein n=1 Tax=Mesorhizobium sp. TaxID=1871066 RepID=UPI000FE7068A|nr:hypothetical protein [Mesorhizobium sp.]RWD39692.1 MAG: hypothetical protein EOS35_33750 [Mesorhizobium sp.]